MWKELMKDLLSKLLETWAGNQMSAKKRESLNRRLAPLLLEMMGRFADSTLDCDAFYALVKSSAFGEMVRLYYFSLGDRGGSGEYTGRMEAYILRQCPSVSGVEAREFLSELKRFYERHLLQVMEGEPEIYALFQMLIRSNRDILAKVSESEENLRRYIDARAGGGQIGDGDIRDYHRVCEKLYSMIRFTGISGAESKRTQNIKDFYVENPFSYYGPEFKPLAREDRDRLGRVRLEGFFENGNKLVLIGGAGFGKTTTLNYLYCNYERLFHTSAVKIKIDLKDCAEDIYRRKKDILDCVAAEVFRRIRRRNLTQEKVAGLLSGFLDRGRCLVIFDGLDEIPAQATRNKVRDEIAAFCQLYYLNRFIISTREVGYLQNQFDDSFLHIRINEFDEEQVKQYSRNWYAAYYGEAPQEATEAAREPAERAFEEFWKRFQIEARRARCGKMIRNPIILILALVIFDIEKSLPNRRVEFYKKCIETFLTVREDRKAAAWLSEKAKGILAMERVVPHIAHYRFTRVERNAGYQFTHAELREAVFGAIRVAEADRINWSAAVDEYGKYLVERTELVREVDENVLDFAHKTFYEYFLAVYFTKQTPPGELCGLLQNWIGDANYDQLARLIVEVVIQNDDPERREQVMAFLFSQCGAEWGRGASFSILADLYAHNLLQPQYHREYHRCVLYHARAVHLSELGYPRIWNGVVPYDERQLVELYCQAQAEPDGFGNTLDALCFLSQGFRDQVRRAVKEGPAAQAAALVPGAGAAGHAAVSAALSLRGQRHGGGGGFPGGGSASGPPIQARGVSPLVYGA